MEQVVARSAEDDHVCVCLRTSPVVGAVMDVQGARAVTDLTAFAGSRGEP